MRTLLLITAIALICSSCGQPGALYLPAKKQTPGRTGLGKNKFKSQLDL